MRSTIARTLTLAITVLAATVIAATDASAATPTLLSVGSQNRHSTGTFSAPGADDVIVSIATEPDRGTDGNFFDENIVGGELLTSDEIAAGRWLSSDQLDPGRYYVLLWASDDDCLGDPGCLSGYSTVLPLTVPKPHQTYRRKVTRVFDTLYLELTIKPLGETQPYRVCWRKKNGARRCLRSKVDGYDWNGAASDEVSVGARAQRSMRRRTTFSWYVAGKRVASRRVRIRRG